MKLQGIRATTRKEQERAPLHVLFETPPYGIFSRIGREAGVSPSFARKVALGLNTSARVAAIALAEAERITAALKRQGRSWRQGVSA